MRGSFTSSLILLNSLVLAQNSATTGIEKDSPPKLQSSELRHGETLKERFEDSYQQELAESIQQFEEKKVVKQFITEEEIEAKMNRPGYLTIPLTYENIASIGLILFLTLLGSVYLFLLFTRRQCNCKVCRGKYNIIHSLGAGGYGEVFLANPQSSEDEVVLKKMLMDDITEADSAQIEARNLRELRSPYIVSYEDDFVHIERGTMEPTYHLMLIMEYCTKGDLCDKVDEYRQKLKFIPEDKIMGWFYQVAEAIRYVHQKDIIHRDIKSANVFVQEDNTVKLGDFGLCKNLKSKRSKVRFYSQVGTDCYFSPETVKGTAYARGKAADVWGLGCILYEMVSLRFMWELPFHLGGECLSDPNVVNELVEELDDRYSKTIKSLIKRLLHPEAAHRPDIDEVLKKKYVKQFRHTNSRSRKSSGGKGSGSGSWDIEEPPKKSGSGGRKRRT
eukprot:CAMPEP_0115003950 /NCGR_PEP_ID=MMETSP0216-20121206/18918_1 /TAXON_ID=223996 /ORGANISM="Protocruzia adherens, Strain Boccale" /LENGTH=445 /DNA_ID=CAMNT_0002369857 /DNA_START=176 /DNA_END=1513 /DNA_ORIENTATION=-